MTGFVNNHPRGIVFAFVLFVGLSSTAAASQTPVARLHATMDGEKVSLRWVQDGAPEELIIFRSRHPIGDTISLAGATQIATVAAGADFFIDYPVPGVPAYYAIVAADAIAAGTIEFEPGRNVTTTPATIPLGSRSRDPEFFSSFVFRSSPLPYLEPWSGMLEGRNGSIPRSLSPQATIPLSPAAEQAVSRLLADKPKSGSAPRRPTVLLADSEADGKGVALTLKSIVDGPFSLGDWAQAREQISNLLTLPVPEGVDARARFYLGQTYFYEGMYDRAVLEFLLAQRYYHAEATAWINASLRRQAITAAQVRR